MQTCMCELVDEVDGREGGGEGRECALTRD